MLVAYQDDDWVHERCLIGWTGLDEVCIATPHWDLYTETVSEYEEVWRLGPRGGRPLAVRARDVVSFDPDELAARLPKLIRRAEASRPDMQEDRARFVSAGAIVQKPAAGAAVVAAEEGRHVPRLPERSGGAVTPNGEDDMWVVLEDRGGFRRGDPVIEGRWHLHCYGDRGVAQRDGVAVAIARFGTYDQHWRQRHYQKQEAYWPA